MPLPDDEWSRGKWELKGLVSMAMGAATVMSQVGVNTQIARRGQNGFLATSDDEGFDVSSHLTENEGLRTRIGAAGRATVVDRYSILALGRHRRQSLLRAAR